MAAVDEYDALSPAQQRALLNVGAGDFRTAVDLGLPPAALQALVRKGLVDERSRRVVSSNPRARVSNEPIIRTYRVSGRGAVVRGRARARERAAARNAAPAAAAGTGNS